MKIKKNKRLSFLVFLFIIVIILILANLSFVNITAIHLRTGKNILEFQEGRSSAREQIFGERGKIYDRNKNIIAQDLERYNIFFTLDANRSTGDHLYHVADKDLTAKTIAPILKMDEQKLRQMLNSDKLQIEIGPSGRNLSPEIKEAIEATNLPGIGFETVLNRYYSDDHFASQIIGFTNYDFEQRKLVGVHGIEKLLDNELTGNDGMIENLVDFNGYPLPGTKKILKEAQAGNDVYLTIDKDIQLLMEQKVLEFYQKTGSEEIWSIVFNPQNGEILGIISYPDFNLNHIDIKDYLNRTSNYNYEPGSTIKSIMYAMVYDYASADFNQYVNADDYNVGYANGNIYRTYYDDPYRINTVFNANKTQYGTITAAESLAKSTNSGTIDLVLKYLKFSQIENYLDVLGFYTKNNILGLEESTGLKNFSNPLNAINTIFGQGSSVTALQLSQAYTAVFNDGILSKLKLVSKIQKGDTVIKEIPTIQKRVFKQGTSSKLLPLLKGVIEEPGATGRSYRLENFDVIGKTGTAEIALDHGGYSTEKFISSVMLASPSNKPEIAMYFAFVNSDIINFDRSPIRDLFRNIIVSSNIKKTNQSKVNEKESDVNYFQLDNYVNHSIDFAKELLGDKSDNIYIIGDGNSVIDQYPKNGTKISNLDNIFLLSSFNSNKMIDLRGFSRKDAIAFAALLGIELRIYGSGYVISQNIEVGSLIQKNDILELRLE